MGNFPTLAKSPTLGNVNDYFVLFKYLPNGQLTDGAQKIKDEKRDKPWDDELKEFLSIRANVVNSILKGILTAIGYFANFGTESLESISEKVNQALGNGSISKTSKDEWYWIWLRDNRHNPISHVASIGMMFHQPHLEQMVAYENGYNNSYTYKKEGYEDITIQYTEGGVHFLLV
jgi:hypothetical protein